MKSNTSVVQFDNVVITQLTGTQVHVTYLGSL